MLIRRHKSIAPPLSVAGAGEERGKEVVTSGRQRRKDHLDLSFEVSSLSRKSDRHIC